MCAEHLCLRRSPASGMWPRLSFRKQGAGTSTSSHKWETYRRRRFGRFSRRRATSILRSVRKERATQKIGQSAIGPPGWLEKGPSASLLVRHVSQRIRSSLAPSIQTLLKPTVCLPLMRRCTRSGRLVIRHWESVLVRNEKKNDDSTCRSGCPDLNRYTGSKIRAVQSARKVIQEGA
jgi:hypothetical protein